MSVMKKKVIIFGVIIVLVLYIIFLHCIISTRYARYADITPGNRLILTTDVWERHANIEQDLCVLEMLDGNDVAAAKERIQQLLYISIMMPPMWELTDSPEYLKAERVELLKRIKKYHEEHKHEIDMELLSNKRAVQQFENL